MKYEEYVGNGTKKRDPEQIAKDLETIRGEMEHTLEELEAKFSPGQLVDEMITRVRGMGEGPGIFARNMGRTVRDNPVPVMLIGIGVASLLYAGRNPPSERTSPRVGDEAKGELRSRAERAKAKGHELKERSREIKEKGREIKERGRELKERGREIKERGREITHRTRELAGGAKREARQTSRRIRRGAARARQRSTTIVNEQPFVVAGLALAAGALLGSSVPISRREHRVMGEAKQRVEHRARHALEEGAERASRVVEAGIEAGREQAEHEWTGASQERGDEPRLQRTPQEPQRSLRSEESKGEPGSIH